MRAGLRDGEGVTAPNWRTEAARAGIVPWPHCRRTMANLGGKAVEVPDLSDPGTLAEFLRRFVTPGGSSTATPSACPAFTEATGIRVVTVPGLPDGFLALLWTAPATT